MGNFSEMNMYCIKPVNKGHQLLLEKMCGFCAQLVFIQSLCGLMYQYLSLGRVVVLLMVAFIHK